MDAFLSTTRVKKGSMIMQSPRLRKLQVTPATADPIRVLACGGSHNPDLRIIAADGDGPQKPLNDIIHHPDELQTVRRIPR
jgi:hypothetical protein